MSNIPNFICIGAQKSGTTSLFRILKSNPDIYLPNVKETHFFDDVRQFEKGLSFYIETFFSDAKGYGCVGEITPSYLFFPEIASRIYSCLGSQTKIIVMLRNPADRAFSHYLMSVRKGVENLSFSDAVAKENVRIKESYDSRIRYSYVSRGQYCQQLKPFLQHFGRENIFPIIFETQFVPNPGKVIGELCDFLGVSHGCCNVNFHENPARVKKYSAFNEFVLNPPQNFKRFIRAMVPNFRIRKTLFGPARDFINSKIQSSGFRRTNEKLSIDERKMLIQKYFESEISDLEEMLDLNLSVWRK